MFVDYKVDKILNDLEGIKGEIIEWIKTDDDLFFFIMWCFGKGMSDISSEIESDRDDEVTKAFNNFFSRLNASKFMH